MSFLTQTPPKKENSPYGLHSSQPTYSTSHKKQGVYISDISTKSNISHEGVFINENDFVRTKAKSRCEITLTGGGKVRIGENSELEITAASVKPMTKDFSANLNKGNVWVAAKAAFGEKKSVAIRTPTAVAAIRGTKYRATAGDDESSVLVYDGKVDVNAAKNISEERKEKRKGFVPGGLNPNKPKFTLGPVTEVSGPYEVTLEDWISLVEGMQINVRKDGKYHMFKFDQSVDGEDEFVKWNQELDSE